MARIFEIFFSNNQLLPDRCRAAILLSPEGTIEVAMQELSENHGRSITNSWPALAELFLASHLPNVEIENVKWFEVYPYLFKCGRENVSRVLLTANGRCFEYEQDPVVRHRIWQALHIEANASSNVYP